MSFVSRLLSLLFLLGVLCFFVDLELFVLSIDQWKEPSSPSSLVTTDAIVVLTGGSERVSTGVDLLSINKGKKLFISGVHAGISLDTLLGTMAVPPDLRACCIILGHAAGSTIGNAKETSAWMESENFHSLRLVTADYHMSRSMLLLQSTMPGVEIIPHPVVPDNFTTVGWYKRPATAKLLVTEYIKYLAALLHVRMAS